MSRTILTAALLAPAHDSDLAQPPLRPGTRVRVFTTADSLGLVSGGAFVALSCWFSDGSCNAGDNVGGFLGYFAVGAVPGVFVGGALGARRLGPERWQQV